MAINVGDAVVKLGLDKTQFSDGMNKVADDTEKGAQRMQKGMRIAAIAITAVGVAGLKLVADARKMNAELGQVAITTGLTTGEMRNLALSLSNVTFRLKSVIATLTLLSRAGVRSKEEMAAIANAFDALADATGSEAETVADQLIPAFRVFGLELPKTAEELDQFTWLVKNTLINLPDFASVMDYVAMYGSELNVTLEEMVAIMAILNDRGMSGAAATRLFRTAVSQASSGTATLNEALGINNELVGEYITKIGTDAVGATRKYYEIANEQFGIIDKLKAGWEDLTFAVGSFLTPLEPVFAMMSGLGPILLMLSMTSIPQLIANVKLLVTSFIGLAAAAGKAVASIVVLAASKIWAWASAIPIAGIAIAIAGIAALAASIALIRNKAAAAAAGLAEGGIVTRPTRTLIGEAGPEAVIPLSKAGLSMGPRELHLHIGNYMGDESSMRQLVRKISQTLQEDSRRNSFGQVQGGYYFGRSSL